MEHQCRDTTKFKATAVLPFVEGPSNFTATYSNKGYMLFSSWKLHKDHTLNSQKTLPT